LISIPVLEISEDEAYIGERFLSFDELAFLLKETQNVFSSRCSCFHTANLFLRGAVSL